MKQERSYPKVIVSPKGERSVLYGHPWIYDQEVSLPEEGKCPIDGKHPEDGMLVDAVSTWEPAFITAIPRSGCA